MMPNSDSDRSRNGHTVVVDARNGDIVPNGDLSPEETQDLKRCERVIQKGVKTFLAVGLALAEVREKRLYRKVSPTFQQYCRERWDLGKSHAHRLIGYAEVANDLSPIGDKTKLLESHVRVLKRLDSDQRIEVWKVAMRRANRQKVTAKVIQGIIEELGFSGEKEPDEEKSGVSSSKEHDYQRSGFLDDDNRAELLQMLDEAIAATSVRRSHQEILRLLEKRKWTLERIPEH